MIVLATACTGDGGSATEWTNESRAHEDQLKSEFDIGFADAPARLFRMVVETSFPSGDGGPRSPSVAAPVANDLALIVENNSGRVFIDEGREVREIVLSDGLVAPSALHAGDALFHVSDNHGLKSFDYSGERQMLVRSFLAINDFAFVTAHAVAVNPIIPTSDAPIVALVRAPGGTMTTSWGSGRGTLVPGPKTAHLASCGERIVVGLAHEPVVFLLDARLESEVAIELPFPKKPELLSLAADEGMVSPAPGVVTAPTFVAGVACVNGASFFVLLDLPWLCILEYDVRNSLVAIHYADNFVPKRHYLELNMTEDRNAVRLTTVAEDGSRTGARAVVQAVAKPHGS